MWNTLSFFSCRACKIQDAVKEGAEDADSVYLYFGVLCQLDVGPHSLCQSGHGHGCLSDMLIELRVERKGVKDGGTQVYGSGGVGAVVKISASQS